MLNEATEEKLQAMKLSGMLSAWTEQRASPRSDELGFDERFGLLVDAEATSRENKRLKRALDEAKLKIRHACVEGIDVLVIDDFAIAPLDDQERQDLLELLDDRYDTGSVIIAGQLAPEHRHEYIGDPTLADAICDRVLHRSHNLTLSGPSRRKNIKTKD